MKTIGEISKCTLDLIDILGQSEMNDFFSYEELSRKVGMDITEVKNRGYLYTALKRLRKDKKMVFDTVRSKGIKRLSDEEIIDTSIAKYKSSIKSKTRKTLEENVSVKYENLDNTTRNKHSCNMTILGLIDRVTSRKVIKTIENKISTYNNPLPMKNAIRMLKRIEK